MAVIDIKFTCGCGFTRKLTRTLEEPKDPTADPAAITWHEILDHVEQTGHTITSITGSIRPK